MMPKLNDYFDQELSVPIHDMTVLWKTVGLVHVPFTALMLSSKLQIRWSRNFSKGIESSKPVLQEYNGRADTSRASDALRNAGNMRAVQKPTLTPEDNKTLIEMARKHGIEPLTPIAGNAVFCGNVSEVIVCTTRFAVNMGTKPSDFGDLLLHTLTSSISAAGGNNNTFAEKWRAESLGDVFQDVSDSIVSNSLEAKRSVRCGELYLLCLEKWI